MWKNMSQASADDAVTIILDAKRKTGSFEVDTVNGKIVPGFTTISVNPAETQV